MDDSGSRSTGYGRRDLALAAATVVGVNAIGASPSLLVGADTGWFDRPWFFPSDVAFPVAWMTLFTLMGVALFLAGVGDSR